MIDHLPLSDAAMLASVLNRLLRDGEFEDLDDICGYYDVARDEVLSRLAAQGYNYSESQKRVA